MHKLCLILFFVVPQVFFANTLIIIQQFPSNTSPNDQLYLAGNVNGWNPVDEDFLFSKNQADYRLDLGTFTGSIQFRITRGSFQKIESTGAGADISNRTLTIAEGDTVRLNVLAWKDLKAVQNGKNITANSNVFVVNPNMFMPQLSRSRRIWVYLPPQYFAVSDSFPVLYMHDGQNLFDASTSFIGEWGIDESMNSMVNGGSKGAIVVGIDNGGNYRTNELTPYVNSSYGGGEGPKYMDFMVNTLMPYINTNFRTQRKRESTGIMGSSLGGLISCYGAVKFQSIFGKIGIFSPAFWFNDEIFTFVDTVGYKQKMRVYFMSGQNESQTMVPKMQQMYDLMVKKGFEASDMKLLVKADGQHSEWFWKREFPAAYQFLFEDYTTGILEKPLVSAQIYPNPVVDQLTIDWSGVSGIFEVTVIDFLGNTAERQTISSGQKININSLKSGFYTLKIADKNTSRTIKFVKE